MALREYVDSTAGLLEGTVRRVVREELRRYGKSRDKE
jgi:hypothetical protein